MVTYCRSCNSTLNNFAIGKIAPFVSNRMLHGKEKELVFECMSCGLLWINVDPSDDDLARHYHGYWEEDYLKERQLHEPGFVNKWCSLENRNKDKYIEQFLFPFTGFPESILDFGGGSGDETPFVGLSSIDIFDVSMIDLAPGCSRIKEINKKYDLVVLCHILEHVPNPQKLLKDSLNACNDNGFVYIEVPDEASLYGTRPRLNTVMKERGAWHEHINYFDPTSLSMLILNSDGKIIKLHNHTWNGGNFIKVLVGKNDS